MQMINKQEHEKMHKRKGSEKVESTGITITIDRFAELIRKESAYDIFARNVAMDRYASDLAKNLFVLNPFEKDGEKNAD